MARSKSKNNVWMIIAKVALAAVVVGVVLKLSGVLNKKNEVVTDSNDRH